MVTLHSRTPWEPGRNVLFHDDVAEGYNILRGTGVPYDSAVRKTRAHLLRSAEEATRVLGRLGAEK